jgi:hypothetical protein
MTERGAGGVRLNDLLGHPSRRPLPTALSDMVEHPFSLRRTKPSGHSILLDPLAEEASEGSAFAPPTRQPTSARPCAAASANAMPEPPLYSIPLRHGSNMPRANALPASRLFMVNRTLGRSTWNRKVEEHETQQESQLAGHTMDASGWPNAGVKRRRTAPNEGAPLAPGPRLHTMIDENTHN